MKGNKIIDWKKVKVGDKIFISDLNGEPYKPYFVTITAIGKEKYLVIDECGIEFAYKKDSNTYYHKQSAGANK